MVETSDRREIKVVHFGLGPIGLDVARIVQQRNELRAVGAVDRDATLIGRDLAQLLDLASPPSGVKVSPSDALGTQSADVVAHCTGSSLPTVAPQLFACIEAGFNVVSTCEELSFPWWGAPTLAKQLDKAARAAGVTIVGTGVNPGFTMDYLPIVLTGIARRINHVRVHRVQDAGKRRLPLQKKVGAGLSVAAFNERVEKGTVRHVGLRESAQAIAASLGWRLDTLTDTIEPIVAERPTVSGLGEIRPGEVLGVRQIARGIADTREVVSLTLEMAVGLSDPRDEIALTGDPDTRMIIPGGLHGDVATAAIVANCLPRVVAAQPGLLTMADLAPPHP